MVQEMTVEQFLARRLSGKPIALIDVREDWEIEVAAAPCEHARIPMGQIAARLGELDAAVDTVVLCHSGGRSLRVARYLETQGFKSVYNLTGGIAAWARDVDPTIAQY